MTKQAIGYAAFVLLLGFIALEWFTFIQFRTTAKSLYTGPTYLLIANLGILITGSYLAIRPMKIPSLSTIALSKTTQHLLFWSLFGVFSFFLFRRLVDFFDHYEISPDIVPALQYYVRRLLAGEKVYAPMPFETWTVIPNYLPLMWLPYLLPELLGIDYRFLPFFLLLLAIAFWAYHLLREPIPFAVTVLVTLLPFLLIFLLLNNRPNDIAHNAEFTPVAFYLFLALAVWRKNRAGLILTILLCLLSRIAFSFWLPMFLVILWIEKGFAYPFRIGIFLLAGIFLIYVLPFVIPDPNSFLAGASYYNKVASDIWTQPWHARDGVPIVLQEGTSFALYFFEQHQDDPLAGLAFAKKFHFWGSLTTAVLLFGIYGLLRKKIDFGIYSVIALKFFLGIFYLLMHTPFAYLYLLPIFMSFPILWLTLVVQKQAPASQTID